MDASGARRLAQRHPGRRPQRPAPYLLAIVYMRLAQPRDAIQDVAVLPERKEPTMSWPLSVVCQVLGALPGW
jgi:hypothetical protein